MFEWGVVDERCGEPGAADARWCDGNRAIGLHQRVGHWLAEIYGVERERGGQCFVSALVLDFDFVADLFGGEQFDEGFSAGDWLVVDGEELIAALEFCIGGGAFGDDAADDDFGGGLFGDDAEGRDGFGTVDGDCVGAVCGQLMAEHSAGGREFKWRSGEV